MHKKMWTFQMQEEVPVPWQPDHKLQSCQDFFKIRCSGTKSEIRLVVIDVTRRASQDKVKMVSNYRYYYYDTTEHCCLQNWRYFRFLSPRLFSSPLQGLLPAILPSFPRSFGESLDECNFLARLGL